MDSHQAKFFDLEAESILPVPSIPSQVTINQGSIVREFLGQSEQDDEKSPTLKSLNTTKYWINLKGKYRD